MALQEFDIPILLVMFNRPDNAQKVFDRIREVKPQKVFVAIDGPRPGNLSDQAGIEACKKILNQVDWPCDLKTNIREENLGCGFGVSSAISWFFEQVEMGIILEDDCVPALSFFPYCKEILVRYQHNDQVMHVAGTRWNEEYPTEHSYLFSSISHIWGWATWRRAWQLHDYQMKLWPNMRSRHILKHFFDQSDNVKYWIKTFDKAYNTVNKHFWDYQWQYTIFLNNGLAIMPRLNLVQNIGVNGIHSKPNPLQRKVHFRPVSDTYTVDCVPSELIANRHFDDYHTKSFFRWRPPVLLRAFHRLRSAVQV